MRPLPPSLFLIAALAAAGPSTVIATDGDVDLTYQSAGQGFAIFGAPGDASPARLLAAPDGNLVVLYHWTDQNGTPRQDRWRQVFATGYGPPCSLVQGSVTEMSVRGAAFDSLGRLIVVGTEYAGTQRIVVERFLYPDCTLDPDFDGNGLAAYLAGEGPYGVAIVPRRVGLFPLTRQVYDLVGTLVPGATHLVVLRLDDDGALDTTWGGGDGRVEISLSGAHLYAEDAALDPQGRIVVASQCQFDASLNWAFAVTRVLSDGTPDPGFSGVGTRIVDFDLLENGTDSAFAVALANDGRIAVVGSAESVGDDVMALAVLLPNGNLDGTFSGDGRLTYGGPLDVQTSGRFVVFQSDGRLLVGGSTYRLAGSAVFTPALEVGFVERYRPDGSPDPAFGDAGLAEPTLATYPDLGSSATAIAAGADGRPLLAGGLERDGTALHDGWIARLDNALIFADGFESGTTGAW
ncbi:MAG: hypothetical protein U0X73_11405 [Thermoanaerobaculia bacterium]